MSNTLSSEFEYTLVIRLGRLVIAEGNYCGVHITHENFNDTPCYFIRAPFLAGNSKQLDALRQGGAWLKQSKSLVIVSWYDIDRANELTLSALYKNFLKHKEENSFKINDIGRFKLKN
jgi:hypothetical protein